MRGGAVPPWAVAVFALAAPHPGAAQEPIFVTSPVTMFQAGRLVGADVERAGNVTTVSSDAAFGVLPWWTVALHLAGVDAPAASAQIARFQLGTRLRLFKRDRPREWILISAYGAAALPLGGAADRAVEAVGAPRDVIGLSVARMARSGDAVADLAAMRVSTPAGAKTGAVAGAAFGWRPVLAAGGGAEAQFFAEVRGRYLEGGAATAGLAPGVLVHGKNVLVKLGVLVPVWTRQTTRQSVVRVGGKLLL